MKHIVRTTVAFVLEDSWLAQLRNNYVAIFVDAFVRNVILLGGRPARHYEHFAR